jgi:anti-anti-sigma factor
MPSDFSAEIADTSNPGAKIIALKGELDESVLDNLRAQLEPIWNNASVQTFIFNLHDLEFINSKGIGFLVSIHSHLARGKRHLIIVDAQEAVMDVISLVGLTSIISYYDTLDEALASL